MKRGSKRPHSEMQPSIPHTVADPVNIPIQELLPHSHSKIFPEGEIERFALNQISEPVVLLEINTNETLASSTSGPVSWSIYFENRAFQDTFGIPVIERTTSVGQISSNTSRVCDEPELYLFDPSVFLSNHQNGNNSKAHEVRPSNSEEDISINPKDESTMLLETIQECWIGGITQTIHVTAYPTQHSMVNSFPIEVRIAPQTTGGRICLSFHRMSSSCICNGGAAQPSFSSFEMNTSKLTCDIPTTHHNTTIPNSEPPSDDSPQPLLTQVSSYNRGQYGFSSDYSSYLTDPEKLMFWFHVMNEYTTDIFSIVEYDPTQDDFIMRFANQKARVSTGYDKVEVIDKYFIKDLGWKREEVKQAAVFIDSLLKDPNHRTVRSETKFRRPDGKTFISCVQTTFLGNSPTTGNPQFVRVATDITQIRELESEVQAKQNYVDKILGRCTLLQTFF